jgi:hypothetical protein
VTGTQGTEPLNSRFCPCRQAESRRVRSNDCDWVL